MSNIESIESLPNLSEFFGELSKEKKRAHKEIKERVADPTTGLSNLFKQLDEAHKETLQKQEMVSSEPVVKKTESSGLSIDDQNKLEIFSNLVDTMNATVEPTVTVAESTNDIEFLSEPTELLQDNNVERTGDIIEDIVNSLDELGLKTKISEEVDQITTLRREFDNFRSLIAQQLASSQMSGAGSGETRLEFLDDVDRDTAKSDGKALVYDSTSGKWKGETILTAAITGLDIDGGTDIGAALVDADLFIVDDGAGGTNRKSTLSRLKTYIGAGAADDLGAGDAAVTLTTTSGNITIDAAANNSDIIFKGTDGGSDITMLTLDGSADGAAIFKSTVTATGIIIGSTAVTSTAAELNILDGVTSTAAELNAVDGITAVVGELNALDLGSTAIGTAIASKAVILDSNKDYTGIRNLTATTHIGALTGNADTATALATARTIGGTSFDGSANIAVALATLATTVTITDNESTNENNAIIFTAGGDVDGGDLGLESDGTLTYNPSTGKITATGFVGTLTGNVTGNLSGNVTGNTSGTAATVTTAAQTNITSVGTLTALTVDNIVINGTNIGHTSDTDALAIDSSGNVTASQNLIVSGDFTVNGTTTTISSTNTVVADNLFELNNGAGSNSNDSGIIIERGSTGDNAIIMWDESADKFQVGTTSATASATGNLSVTSGILVASSFEGDLASAVIENSGQITSDSFNLPITLNGTNGSSANAGDNIVQDTAANANDRIVYEDATPTHYERPITWDRTT